MTDEDAIKNFKEYKPAEESSSSGSRRRKREFNWDDFNSGGDDSSSSSDDYSKLGIGALSKRFNELMVNI